MKKLTLLLLLFVTVHASAIPFDMGRVSIYYKTGPNKLDSIVAHLLAADIERVMGYRPPVGTDITTATGRVILIGDPYDLKLQYGDSLQGQWERYTLQVVDKPFKGVSRALVIAGSDARGTAFGVFDISQRIGVSPWYWWADVVPEQQKKLVLDVPPFLSATPAVQYRGIFLNDEDWGLQPWAAKTFEPEVGDIGPRTYEKIFELLLRLKANMIWPAMHHSTQPFYTIPGNAAMAALYGIVVGSSHAEPMARSNTREWDKQTMGAFNYLTNHDQVDKYWEARIKEVSRVDAVYTVGMRGISDSGIEGVKTAAETVPLLEKIFQSQRRMLQQYVNPDITKVPQAFTAYKEVLDVYNAGLKVPGDVTLIWPDDNYGYIQRLSNTQEQQRPGGSGVYYHISYLGRPHDYLWLPSAHPALIREEMLKAYQQGSRKIWIVNVGDIKPCEYGMQYFLDMAWNIQPFLDEKYTRTHLKQWIGQNIHETYRDSIADILWQYYQLAFERKPEFMGWSQTEPTTPIHPTTYNHEFYGDQGQKRLDAYARIENVAKRLKNHVPGDTYYQQVYYPVRCAALINQKFLYKDKARLYAQQGRLSYTTYDSLSQAAYNDIVKETAIFNQQEKWRYMMHMAPNKRPVFSPLEKETAPTPTNEVWQVRGVLPVFTGDATAFVDVFLCQPQALDYKISTPAKWIRTSVKNGHLSPGGLASQQRIWVSIDWATAPQKDSLESIITITAGGHSLDIKVQALRQGDPGYLVKAYNEDGLGTDKPVTWQFNLNEKHDAAITLYTLPTFPLNNEFEARYAVSVDDGPQQVLNIHTYGRSPEWKEAVLGNTIARQFNITLTPGAHTIKVQQVDPGIILQRIIIDLGGLQPYYGSITNTDDKRP